MTIVPNRIEGAAKHVAARDAQIPKEWKFDSSIIPHNPSTFYRHNLSEDEIHIVELDATALARAIAEGTYTSAQVTEAYLKSAAAAHAGTNCLAWFDVELARQRARWLDQQLMQSGKPVGPLHGVPMSVKDFLCVKGFTQSSGHLSSAGHTPQEDADIVAIFRAAGVVFFAKTTQPQSIMHLETSNFYGTTTNAYNRLLTCGGSSGGEGALVGCHGSPIGISTDPTTKRVPRDGMLGVTAHSRICGSIGPVCHSVRDMDLFYKVLFEAQSWKHDIKLVPLGWRHVDTNGQGAGFDGWSGQGNTMRIGIIRDDGVVRPVAPVRRALDAVVGKLSARTDVELVEFPQLFSKEAWSITQQLYYTDGGRKLDEALGDEPKLPLTEWITSKAKDLNRQEVDALVARRNSMRQLYYDHFKSFRLDVILSPAGPAPAQPLETTKYWSYTSFWNLLDWPAAVFPTGLHVDPAVDEETYPNPNNEAEEHLFSTYSATIGQGSPIGLQLIAPRWQDERLMAALKKIDQVLPLA
ncbi:uncharacterized protein I303_102402 [Kwoniella dejecticola CBS 10117]|uniref:Amidase domain-containing protein n=1 Tax=Kwoniella dejecticola CBS 10117 TaxID=1296121 RepID=A0A1A6A8M5_9TREE|nr:uncharacterized protein I303_02416 [Kwoniella dejecticola CBS 10117]OBR86409.1 hypothetical protein I303_02416 [Kwoniella dejecticola CBS 10117]